MATSPERFVLDSYALIAYLEDEPAAERVAQLLGDAAADRVQLALCWVNAGEIVYLAERERGRQEALRVLSRLEDLPLALHPADREVTIAAARLKAQYSIAYVDCFAAALAHVLEGTVVTGDPEFEALAGEISIEWLPRKGG